MGRPVCFDSLRSIRSTPRLRRGSAGPSTLTAKRASIARLPASKVTLEGTGIKVPVSDADAQARGAYTRAQLSAGDDPSLMAYANLAGYMGGQDQMSKNLMNAQLQSMMENQRRIENFYNPFIGYNAIPKQKQDNTAALLGAGTSLLGLL